MRSIAVLGASRHRQKFGNKCLRAYLAAGWNAIPINPFADVVEGVPTLPTLSALEKAVDRVTVYLAPEQTRSLLPEIASVVSAEVWFNPGSTDALVCQEARSLGINLIEGCSIVDIGASPADFP